MVFAQSCEIIGEIYFLSAKQNLAENQWAIGLAIYQRYGESPGGA